MGVKVETNDKVMAAALVGCLLAMAVMQYREHKMRMAVGVAIMHAVNAVEKTAVTLSSTPRSRWWRRFV
jgi:hypothetical protein